MSKLIIITSGYRRCLKYVNDAAPKETHLTLRRRFFVPSVMPSGPAIPKGVRKKVRQAHHQAETNRDALTKASFCYTVFMKSNSLLKEASDIAERMYKVADKIESYEPDEKWRTVSKLKNSANDAYYYIAQVAGAGKGQSFEYDCINARKYMNTMKSMYVFASKQDMVELEPELVVRIEKLIAEIDDEQVLSQKHIKSKADDELKPWLEKYRIWQKISKD